MSLETGVRLRARCNDAFTGKRVLKFMAAIWILNILLTSLQWAGINQISRDIYFILWLLCLLVFVVTSIGIRLILRRFHRQSHCHNTIFENMRKQRELNLTRNISFIVGVYLLLNMPLLFIKPVSPYFDARRQDL